MPMAGAGAGRGCRPFALPGRRAWAFPDELRANCKPIAEMDALIEERTGAKPGTIGGFLHP
jgi:hypothetical protein